MIERWGEVELDADANMPEAILVELAGQIRRHPWWRARARLTAALLDRLGVRPPARVLDAGCGWGVTLEDLERRGYRVDGLDVSRLALERLDRDRPGRRLIQADLSAPPPGPAADSGGYDAVLALDVIEHLDDDRGAVGHLARLARPGGVAVVSVPADPGLFGEFDRVQGHRRRYLPETFRAAFEGSGLNLERLLWWGGWMIPLVRLQRRRSRALPNAPALETYRRYLAMPPWPIPLTLDLAYAMEQGRALDGRLKGGTSLFAVARRD